MNDHLWWYVARSSGFAAWGCALASLLFGMALSTRALGRRPRGPWLLDVHRLLGAVTLVFVGVHLTALLADEFVQFDIADLLVPFVSDYRTTAVAWGVVAFWLLVAVEGTSLLMHRMPRRLWYGVHLTSYVVALATTLHALYAGTDTTNPVFQLVGLGALGAAGFFAIYRAIAPVEARGRNSTRATTAGSGQDYAAHLHAQGPQPPDWL